MTPGIVGESDLSGNLTDEYVFFDGERVARIDLPANTVHYYLSDHLGSTSIVASAAGAVEEESDYYPFGTEVMVIGPGINELKFTGKRRDTESQLDYFGARYYSNLLGRWTSPDWSATPVPVPYANVYDPQSLNLYGYVRNVPTSRIDNDGHDCKATGQRFDCNYHFPPDQGKEAHTVPFPLPFVRPFGGVGAATATLAAGTLVVGAAYLFITRTTDAIVANYQDEELSAARYSEIAVDNLILMSNTKQQQKVVDGLVNNAREHADKIDSSDPNDPNRNGWKREAKAALDRAKVIANRLPGKARQAAMQTIKSIEGRIK
jgi:RHS repeat-associated protein